METLLQDVRFAWRGLRRTPGITLAAVATLALALGVNTALFSAVHALLLRPLPFAGGGELVRLYCNQPEDVGASKSPSEPEVAAWQEETGVFSGVVGYRRSYVNRTGGEVPERLGAVRTTPNLLEVLGVAPVAGRALEPADAWPGAAPVTLLSHELARRLFTTPEAAVGQTLWLDGKAVGVVGVLPAGFVLGEAAREADVWLPLPLRTTPEALGHHHLVVLARLKPGVGLEAAREAASCGISRLGIEDGAPPHTARALPWQEAITRHVRSLLLALWAAAGFVLLIACANVANLLLARAVHHRRESAIRSALGASRSRRLREVLTESMLLSLLGGAVGMLLALWVTDVVFGRMLSPALRQLAPPELHLPVLLFAAGLCALAGLLSGVAPALESTRASLLPLLAGGRGATGPRHPLRAALVVIQLALAVVLLTGAGLAVRTLAQLSEVELGFQPEGVVSAPVQLPPRRYPDEAARVRAATQLEEALSALPGVHAVGLLQELHLSGSTTSSYMRLDGNDEGGHLAENRVASPGAFTALEVPLKAGRLFTEADAPGAPPVALVNEAFVRAYMAGREPIGARVNAGGETWWTVVGVVGDVRHDDLTAPPGPALYNPAAQRAPSQFYLLVRASPPPSLAQVRAAVRSVDPELPMPSVEPLGQVVSRSRERHTLLLSLLSALSALALVLASLGVWGVVAYGVTQRLRELSIRRALGATDSSLVRLVVGGAARLVGVALVLGLPAAVALAHGARSLLYGVAPTDVPTLLGTAALLGVVGLVAAWLPARRAARVDPALALRAE